MGNYFGRTWDDIFGIHGDFAMSNKVRIRIKDYGGFGTLQNGQEIDGRVSGINVIDSNGSNWYLSDYQFEVLQEESKTKPFDGASVRDLLGQDMDSIKFK